MIVNTLWGPEEIQDTKLCNRCNKVKHFSLFGMRSYRKNGTPETKNTCKKCLRKDTKILAKARKFIPKPDKNYICPWCRKTKEEKLKTFGSLQGNSPATSKTIWTLDHNHSTSEIREYICLYCNDMLGRCGDCSETLRKGAEYLEKHNREKNEQRV